MRFLNEMFSREEKMLGLLDNSADSELKRKKLTTGLEPCVAHFKFKGNGAVMMSGYLCMVHHSAM